jgi:hypothetical protein
LGFGDGRRRLALRRRRRRLSLLRRLFLPLYFRLLVEADGERFFAIMDQKARDVVEGYGDALQFGGIKLFFSWQNKPACFSGWVENQPI